MTHEKFAGLPVMRPLPRLHALPGLLTGRARAARGF